MTQPLPLTYADWVDEDDVDPLGKETTSDLQNLIQDVIHVIEEDPEATPTIRNEASGSAVGSGARSTT